MSVIQECFENAAWLKLPQGSSQIRYRRELLIAVFFKTAVFKNGATLTQILLSKATICSIVKPDLKSPLRFHVMKPLDI